MSSSSRTIQPPLITSSMAIREGLSQSLSSRKFVLETLEVGKQRIDGRDLSSIRNITFNFTRTERQATALIGWGKTQVLATVSCEIVAPYLERPSEGILQFNAEMSKMADASIGSQRTSPLSIEICRIMERSIRESQALDTETLCIILGKKVWQLSVDVYIVDNCGNLIDSSALAAISALQYFRLPCISVEGDESVTVHHSDLKEPTPLAIHHIPLCFTFGLFASKEKTVAAIDPNEVEEFVMKGRVTYAFNNHKEICALHKNGGMAISVASLMHCSQIASTKVQPLYNTMKSEMLKAEHKFKQAREARLRGHRFAEETENINTVMSNPQPMAVAPETKDIKHLGYDELHVIGRILEGPEQGLGGHNRAAFSGEGEKEKKSSLYEKMIEQPEDCALLDDSAPIETEDVEMEMEERKECKVKAISGVETAEKEKNAKVGAATAASAVAMDAVAEEPLDLKMAVKERKKKKKSKS